MRVTLTFAAVALTAVTAGPITAPPVGAAPNGTSVQVNCGSGNPFTITTSAPNDVVGGGTADVQFDAALREFFGIPAPYAGTITSSLGFAASNATPATFTLTTPVTHFNAGDLGPSTTSFGPQSLTATGAYGTDISVQFLSFSYTIASDSGNPAPFTRTCQPNAETVLARIPIVSPPKAPQNTTSPSASDPSETLAAPTTAAPAATATEPTELARTGASPAPVYVGFAVALAGGLLVAAARRRAASSR